jgi:hypothetical protein
MAAKKASESGTRPPPKPTTASKKVAAAASKKAATAALKKAATAASKKATSVSQAFTTSAEMVPVPQKKATSTVAAAKKTAAHVLAVDPTPTSTATTSRPPRSRPVFAPPILDPGRSTFAVLDETPAQSVAVAALLTPIENALANPESRIIQNVVSMPAVDAISSTDRDLVKENQKLVQELNWYRGKLHIWFGRLLLTNGLPMTEMMATGKPVAAITKPAVLKDSALRLAPFDVAIGLATSPDVDKDVNLSRKRMISWLWVSAIINLLADSLSEMPTLCKPGYDS